MNMSYDHTVSKGKTKRGGIIGWIARSFPLRRMLTVAALCGLLLPLALYLSIALFEARSMKRTVFYNLYVAPQNEENSYRIANEQLHQIADSYLGAKSIFDRSVTRIFYTTIGSKPDTARVEGLCNKLGIECEHRKHFERAFEEATLEDLYEYCTEHVKERVGYMHSKGSYVDRDSANDIWRWHMTLAMSHKHCWHPPNDKCNVCGLDFWPSWTLFFPGNIWTAKCSYVNLLKPPKDILSGLTTNFREASTLVGQGKLNFGLFHDNMWPPQPDRLGLERYANEHWIGTHPDLIPCDMSNRKGNHDLWASGERVMNANELQWSMSPRHAMMGDPSADEDYWIALSREKELKLPILKDEVARRKEYFLLPGYLHKWISLYQQVPSQDSWVWQWFPDGEYWKQVTRKHGIGVLRQVLTAPSPSSS